MLYTSAIALVAAAGQRPMRRGRLEERLKHFGKPKLLSSSTRTRYCTLERTQPHLFPAGEPAATARGTSLVTSSRAVSGGACRLRRHGVATAILDRLLHHSHIHMHSRRHCLRRSVVRACFV
ncbi:MAG: hypothetical protein H6736_13450 [Alphaproteobacteria bacterium]|nr:hypothetical protein [Alphaproteobacteria bacterium]